MAAKSSDLGDKMSEANLQADGQVEKPAQGAVDWQEMKEENGSLPNSPTWSPVQRPPLGCLNTKYCLEIWVTLTDELGDVPHHHMLGCHQWWKICCKKPELTEAVVIGPGRAILFYERRLMGEGLKADEARDAVFLLTGAGTWVGKSAYLTADPMTIQEGRRTIAQAVLDNRVKVRGPGLPHVNLPAQQHFKFNTPRASPPGDMFIHCGSDNEWEPRWPPRGQGHNRRQRDQQPWSPWFPSPSPDCGFKSDRRSISTVSLMSSRLDHSDRYRHSKWGRRHWEEMHMKINLPIFKDEDPKDAVTYQSWRWDLTVYRHAGCRDRTLLPYAIRSLQGYPRELVQSSITDITLDDVLMILDEHYNNVKVLDPLNQELFQMRMADKETVSDWDVCLSRHLQILAVPFQTIFPQIL